VGRGSVFPAGPDFAVGIPDAVIQNIAAVLDEDFVCSAHGKNPPVVPEFLNINYTTAGIRLQCVFFP
jgi:hypothetical protein